MDQGFVSQGFATQPQGFATQPQGLTAPVRAPVPIARAPQAPHTLPHSTRMPEAAPPIAAAKPPKLHGDAAMASNFEAVQSATMMPINFEFGAIILGGLFGWLKMNKTKSAIKAVFSAPVEAMRSTTVKDILHVPGNTLKAASVHGEEAGKFGASIVGFAARHAENWLASGSKLAQSIAEKSTALLGGPRGQKLTSFFGKTAGFVGRASVFNALIVAGAAAGVGATMFAYRAASKESLAALKQLTADVGGTLEGSFAQGIKAAQKKQSGINNLKYALRGVGNAGNAYMFTAGNIGMGTVAALSLPDAVNMLVQDNDCLAAYTALQKRDRREMPLSPDDEYKAVNRLVSLMPAVASHGGEYSKLGRAITQQMIQEKMPAAAIARLLNNDAAFTVYADNVSQKMAQHGPTSVTQESAKGPSQTPSQPAVSKAVVAYNAQPKPATAGVQLGAGTQAQGRVTGASHHVVSV